MADNSTSLYLTSLDGMTMWDKNNNLVFSLDELQDVSLSNNEETSDITGKNGRKIATLKQNKTVSITGNNGLISGPLMSAQTGGTYTESESYTVYFYDQIRIEDPLSAQTSYKAVGFPGNEIRAIVFETNGGSVDTLHPMKQTTDAPSAGTFNYDPESRELRFAAGELEVGDIIRVYYSRNVKASHVSNPADKFSIEGLVVIDCQSRDLCQNYYRSQIVIPRADFTGNFNLEMGSEQAVHNFEINALASVSVCDKVSSSVESIYWDFITFGLNSEDA